MKVSFIKDTYKEVETFNDRVTVVTLTGNIFLPQAVKTAIHDDDTIYEWLKHHNNPRINGASPWKWVIVAKGKAIRADGDVNDYTFAERIAECRAKMTIYKFMKTLVNKCIEFYVNLLVGNGNQIDAIKIAKGSLCDDALRYDRLLKREQEHLKELLKG